MYILSYLNTNKYESINNNDNNNCTNTTTMTVNLTKCVPDLFQLFKTFLVSLRLAFLLA